MKKIRIILVLFSFLQHAVSGYLIGPKEVTGALGGSIKISCYYKTISANLHGRKFWCKLYKRDCTTIISTSSYIAKDHTNKIQLEDFQSDGKFVVEMTQLDYEDAGPYRCGIGNNNNGYYYGITLTVSEGSNIPSSSELIMSKLRSSLVIHCPTQEESSTRRKFWCKMDRTNCAPVVNSDGFVHRDLWGRALIKEEKNSTGFVVMVNDLKKSDSGFYRCGSGLYKEGLDWKDVHVFISSDKEKYKIFNLLSTHLSANVSMVCPLTTELRPSSLVSWCRWSESGCTKLIDSSGFVQDKFTDRLVLKFDNIAKGNSTLQMTKLELGDNGWYWCVISNGLMEQSSSVELRVFETTTLLYTSNTTSNDTNESIPTALPSTAYTGKETNTSLFSSTNFWESSASGPILTSAISLADITGQERNTSLYHNITYMGEYFIASSAQFTSALPTTNVPEQETNTSLYSSTDFWESSSASGPLRTSAISLADITGQETNSSLYPSTTNLQAHNNAPSLQFTSALPTPNTADQVNHSELYPSTVTGQRVASSLQYITTLIADTQTDEELNLSTKLSSTVAPFESRSKVTHVSLSTRRFSDTTPSPGSYEAEVSTYALSNDSNIGYSEKQDISSTQRNNSVNASQLTGNMSTNLLVIITILLAFFFLLATIFLIKIKLQKKRAKKQVPYKEIGALVVEMQNIVEPTEITKFNLSLDVEAGETEV